MRLARMLMAIRRSPQPVIARVHGDAFGGGVGLICAADIAIGTPEVHCALSEVRLGLLPATIGPHVLAAMGPRAASRYMLTAERIGAEEALRIGLLHQVVPADALDSTVDALIRSLLANGPQALAATKALIREVSGRALDDALLEDTAARIAAARASPEGAEGVAAFLDKRKPRWAL
jgi:methylglutaconyl-CoA hydratase